MSKVALDASAAVARNQLIVEKARARPASASWPFDMRRDYLSARGFDLAKREAEAQTLYETDPARLVAIAEAASGRLDLETILSACAVLRRHGALNAPLRAAYADALVQERRHEEAVQVLGDVLIDTPGEPYSLFALAEALAACGEFETAADRARDVPRTWPKVSRADVLICRLGAVAELIRREADLSWSEGCRLVDGCIGLGAFAQARAAMLRLLDRHPLGEPTRDVVVALARASRTLDLRHPRLWRLIKDLWRAHPDDPAVCAVRIESLLLHGHGEAVDLARSPSAPRPKSSKLDLLSLSYAQAAAHVVADHLEPAIRLLGDVFTRHRADVSAYNALQFVVGRYVLSKLDLPWAPPRPPKVINLIPYFNERTLLELRLQEMGGWVDHFVIVEASTTFTGLPKPRYFERDRQAFADRGSQLLHVAISEIPDCCDTAWARDLYQRDMAVSALAGLWRPDDIILITDADEIIDRRALRKFRTRLAAPRMVTSKYFFNYVAQPGNTQSDRRSGAICPASVLTAFGSTYLRALAATGKRWDTIPKAGWHFTSLGDAAKVAEKLNAYAHQENSKIDLRSETGVGQVLKDILGGIYEAGWTRAPIDNRFPEYVVERQNLLRDKILET